MSGAAKAPKPAKVPKATRAGRLLDYLNEMFPPAMMVPASFASFAAAWFGLHALAGIHPAHFTWRTVLAAITSLLCSLLLRVYDELKDVETDLRLGRAGDPRYKDRAIVTGRVQAGDIVALRNGLVVAVIACNVPLGFPLPFLVFAGMLALLWLSSVWFFWPGMSKHLLAAFATHSPLAMAISSYVVAVFVRESGVAPPHGTVALVVGFWTLTAGWELARKVRHPSEETDYITYSRVLGPRVAALAPLVVTAAGVVLLGWVCRLAGLGWLVPGLVLAAWLPLAAACLRFAIAPAPGASNLRPYVELLVVVVSFALPIALGIHVGARFW
jgi:hypothetical protein